MTRTLAFRRLRNLRRRPIIVNCQQSAAQTAVQGVLAIGICGLATAAIWCAWLGMRLLQELGGP